MIEAVTKPRLYDAFAGHIEIDARQRAFIIDLLLDAYMHGAVPTDVGDRLAFVRDILHAVISPLKLKSMVTPDGECLVPVAVHDTIVGPGRRGHADTRGDPRDARGHSIVKRSKKAMKARTPQPMQPVIEDDHGTLRFRANALIRHIVDHAGDVVHPGSPATDLSTGKPYHQGKLDLGELMSMDFPQEDKEQFAQLMGYSVAGYHELSFVSDESCADASILAEQVRPGSTGGCRDDGCPLHGGPLFSEEGLRLT